MVGVLGLLYASDWRIGLGLTLFVAVAVATMLRLRAVATPFSAAERQAAADAYGFLGEYLAGLEDVRASGARSFVLRRWAELMRRWLAAKRGAQMRGYGMVAASQGLFALGTAFALALGAMLYREGSLTIGAVFLVFRYTEMLRQPIERIRDEVQDLQQAAPASAGSTGCSIGGPASPTDRTTACRPAPSASISMGSGSATSRAPPSSAGSRCTCRRNGCSASSAAPAAGSPR
jgi:ATP-binding cassette subfamily B protein/ATP-binding cassette subfamily C protein